MVRRVTEILPSKIVSIFSEASLPLPPPTSIGLGALLSVMVLPPYSSEIEKLTDQEIVHEVCKREPIGYA